MGDYYRTIGHSQGDARSLGLLMLVTWQREPIPQVDPLKPKASNLLDALPVESPKSKTQSPVSGKPRQILRGYMGIMEKKMETTIVYWGYIGIMEKKMETTIVYMGYMNENHRPSSY